MRRSVTGFVCGLIGSLFSLWWGFWFGVIGNVGTLISSAAGSVRSHADRIHLLRPLRTDHGADQQDAGHHFFHRLHPDADSRILSLLRNAGDRDEKTGVCR